MLDLTTGVFHNYFFKNHNCKIRFLKEYQLIHRTTVKTCHFKNCFILFTLYIFTFLDVTSASCQVLYNTCKKEPFITNYNLCLFVRMSDYNIGTDRFTSNFDWGTRKNHGNVLSLVLKFQVKWFDFYALFPGQFIIKKFSIRQQTRQGSSIILNWCPTITTEHSTLQPASGTVLSG